MILASGSSCVNWARSFPQTRVPCRRADGKPVVVIEARVTVVGEPGVDLESGSEVRTSSASVINATDVSVLSITARSS